MVWRVRRNQLIDRLWLWNAKLALRCGRWVMRWERLDNNTRNDLGVEVLKLEAAMQDKIRRGTWTYLKDLA